MIDFLGFMDLSCSLLKLIIKIWALNLIQTETYSVVDSVYINLHYLLPGSKKMQAD